MRWVPVLTRSIGVLAAVPFGTMRIPRPPLWAVFAWYAELLAIASWLRRGRREVGLDAAPHTRNMPLAVGRIWNPAPGRGWVEKVQLWR